MPYWKQNAFELIQNNEYKITFIQETKTINSSNGKKTPDTQTMLLKQLRKPNS